MREWKEVNNQECGAFGCNVTATMRVVFSVGFSAFFCERCAVELIKNGMGVIERSPGDSNPEQMVDRICAGD